LLDRQFQFYAYLPKLPHQALDAAPRIPFGFEVFLSNFALPQGHFRSTGRRFV
jgi:hypothetical protein